MRTMSAEASANTAVWRRWFFAAPVIAAVADVGSGSKRVACLVVSRKVRPARAAVRWTRRFALE